MHDRRQHKDSFLALYVGYFAHPGRTASILLSRTRNAGLGAFAVLVPAVGYTIMYLCGWLAGGAPSTFKPWLAIPIEQYFKYDIFIVAPSMFMCWVLASGVVQLLARVFSDKGHFEDTAAVLGFGIGVGTWASLIHDLTDSVLAVLGVINMKEYEAMLNGPTFWRVLLWTLYSIYFVWLVTLFSIGLRRAHGLSRVRSILLGVAALIVYQGVYLVFNR